MRSALTALLVVISSACGSRSSTESALPGPSYEEFCAEYVAIRCEAQSRCCGTRDVSACTTPASSLCDELRSSILELSPDASYDPAAAAACLTTMKSVFSRCSHLGTDLAGIETDPRSWTTHACFFVFNGRAGTGEACKEASDCAYRDGGSVSCQNTCEFSPAPVSQGQSCSGGRECEWGSSCDAVTQTCSPMAKNGRCDPSEIDCSLDEVCSAAGQCIVPIGDGQPCATDGECASKHCVSNSCTPQCPLD